MKESPLNSVHVRLGARMKEESGWRLPAGFTSLLDEHLATRTSAALFDLSHLGKFSVSGPGALDWLEALLSRSLCCCADGMGVATLMLNDQGMILDRLTVCRESAGRFFLLSQAAQAEQDFAWLQRHCPGDALALRDESEDLSAIGICGPASKAVFARVLRGVDWIQEGAFRRVFYDHEELRVSRLGVVAEPGFELFCPASSGIRWYEAFLAAGAQPCGLEAQECLRVERAHASIRGDLQGHMTPQQAGLAYLCSEEKDFRGAAALRREREHPPVYRLAVLVCEEKGLSPSAGARLLNDAGEVVGQVTSCCRPPHTGRGMAMARLRTAFSAPGTRLHLLHGGQAVPVRVVDMSIQ